MGKPFNETNKTYWEFLRVRLNRPSWFQRLGLMSSLTGRWLMKVSGRPASSQRDVCIQKNDHRLKSRATSSIWINLVPTCMFTSRAESQSSAFSVLTVTFYSQMDVAERAAVVGVGGGREAWKMKHLFLIFHVVFRIKVKASWWSFWFSESLMWVWICWKNWEFKRNFRPRYPDFYSLLWVKLQKTDAFMCSPWYYKKYVLIKPSMSQKDKRLSSSSPPANVIS